jgi:hypothetical protein
MRGMTILPVEMADGTASPSNMGACITEEKLIVLKK